MKVFKLFTIFSLLFAFTTLADQKIINFNGEVFNSGSINLKQELSREFGFTNLNTVKLQSVTLFAKSDSSYAQAGLQNGFGQVRFVRVPGDRYSFHNNYRFFQVNLNLGTEKTIANNFADKSAFYAEHIDPDAAAVSAGDAIAAVCGTAWDTNQSVFQVVLKRT